MVVQNDFFMRKLFKWEPLANFVDILSKVDTFMVATWAILKGQSSSTSFIAGTTPHNATVTLTYRINVHDDLNLHALHPRIDIGMALSLYYYVILFILF